MGFRFKRGVPLDYNTQGYIYFTSRMYKWLPVARQKVIQRLCEKAGGEYREALFEFVTTDSGAEAVCRRHYLSRSTLERCVRTYYRLFARVI